EKPALESREDLLPRERPHTVLHALVLEHAHVVFERRVRLLENVVELVALEEVIVSPRLVARPVLRIDGAADSPESTVLAFDPDHDALQIAAVVEAVEHSLREAPGLGRAAHGSRIQSPSPWPGSGVCSAVRSRSSSPGRATRNDWPPTSSASTAVAATS